MNSPATNRDIREFAASFALAADLKSKRFIITGATGLIGRTLVRCLSSLDQHISIILPVRNADKARELFNGLGQITIIECDLADYLSKTGDQADYLIHCASPTNGKFISEHPAEVLDLAFQTTKAALELTNRLPECSMVYLSSVEFYGEVNESEPFNETHCGHIDFDSPRSAYPLSKQCAEALCKAYASEYGTNVMIARLTQTFGAGADIDDNRVFAQFARSIIANRDIVLHTTGESAKPYCYSTDAASAILYILLKGKRGWSYNVANADTYVSIKELAHYLCDRFSTSSAVRTEINNNAGYAPVTHLNLKTSELENLGWAPLIDLEGMFTRYLGYLKEQK